jgi:hypothetical protein
VKTQASCILLAVLFLTWMAGCEILRHADIVNEPYLLNVGLRQRAISSENPTGAPGQGGKAASHLGVGRLHVLFRQENPTTLKQDFVLLPRPKKQAWDKKCLF